MKEPETNRGVSHRLTHRLFKDDTKTLAPKQYILGQVLDGLLLTLSSYLFKYNKRVYMLPETFCSYVNKDISLEKTIPCNFEDIDFIVALSYFNSYWSLVMIDCTQRYIYYLDPLNNYVRKHKVDVDIEVVTRIIWFHVLRKPHSEENIPSVTPDWTIVTSKNFRPVSSSEENNFCCQSAENFHWSMTSYF